MLGSGGMGEVYLAEDTKLARRIALKVLPAEMAENPERRQRFEREAKAVAALNHPNIVTIHSVEEAEGVHFYTMEYVKGKTLSELIPKTGLPLNKFFDVAIPLSDAISTAHDHSITHRDLKPDNIMVSGEGRLKILDFGLAKLKHEFVEAGVSELPTQTATQEGRIFGTVAYMSPEQAEGKSIDHRSDIFSLGIILYEMATGRRPFEGDTTASILSSIIKDKPESATDINPNLPKALARIIRICLVKDTEHRYQTAKDIRNELEELKQELDSGEVLEGPAAAPSRPSPTNRLAVAGIAAAITAVVVGAYFLLRPAPVTAPTAVTFTKLTSEAGMERFPSLSPDGQSFIYAGQESGNWDIYLKRVGGQRAFNLTEDSPDDDTMPAYSHDGQRIAFRSERDGGGLFVMDATGESVRRLTDFGYDPAWSPDDGQIAFATEGVYFAIDRRIISQLWIVDLETGETKLITEGDATKPDWSPHGQRIAYQTRTGIWTISADGGEPVKVTEDDRRDHDPVWSPDGRSLFLSSIRGGASNIWRVAIDEETGETSGEPVPVTSGAAASNRMDTSLSLDGETLVYVEHSVHQNLQRFAFDPSSETPSDEPVPLTHGSRILAFSDCSPDGEWLVFQMRMPTEDIGIFRTDGSGERKLTDDPYSDRHPRWSPDGERIAFGSTRTGKYEIWSINKDGSGLERHTDHPGPESSMYPVWSPDGAFLAYRRMGSTTIMKVGETTGREPPPSVAPFNEEGQFVAWSWSQDGKRLAGYRRLEDGTNAGIVIYSFDSREFERLTEFGRNPVWLSDNRRLLFFHPYERKLFLVDSETRDWKELVTSTDNINFPDISPDNRYIYASVREEEADVWLLTFNEER
jgi:serine/threonine protein kinase/Tol biopolymer transport system component